MKGSNLAPITKRAETTVLKLVCEGASEGDVRDAVLEMVKPIRKGEYELKEITSQTRMGTFPSKTPAAQAAGYYNEHVNNGDKYVQGDSVKWVYVSHAPHGKPSTKYAAYREATDLDGFEVDKKIVVEKLVENKIKGVFSILGWDIDAALGEPRPADYW